MVSEIAAFFLTAFISVLAIINPLSTIGLFLSLTRNDNPERRHHVAFRTSLTGFCVLVFFAATGFFIFQIYGITIDAFRIAGGIILFIIGVGMLFPHPHREGSEYGKQIYIVPLGIPMTSGPGAITTVAVLAGQATSIGFELALGAAIFLACAVNYVVLRFAGDINRKFGQEGIMAFVKIMGLLVCAVGVQFMLTGLKAAFPILA